MYTWREREFFLKMFDDEKVCCSGKLWKLEMEVLKKMKTHNLSLSLQLSPNECVKRGFSEMKQSFRGKWGCNSATAKRELNKVKPICPPMEMPKPHQKFLHNPWVFFYAKTIQATPTNLPSANSIVCWGRNKNKLAKLRRHASRVHFAKILFR